MTGVHGEPCHNCGDHRITLSTHPRLPHWRLCQPCMALVDAEFWKTEQDEWAASIEVGPGEGEAV